VQIYLPITFIRKHSIKIQQNEKQKNKMLTEIKGEEELRSLKAAEKINTQSHDARI
jgi:hypothetical protein